MAKIPATCFYCGAFGDDEAHHPTCPNRFEPKATATQIGGDHYKQYTIQPAEFCQKNDLNWCESNVIKYICRWDKKGTPLKDLQKAKHYIDLLIELEGIKE